MPWRVATLLLVVLGAGAWAGSEANSPEEITLRTLAGGEVTLGLGQPGEPLIIHFWASWCPSCIEELPHLDELVRERCSGRVRVLAVNLVESSEIVSRVVRERALSLEIARDPDGSLFRRLAGGSMPANYLRTPEGVSRSDGPMSREDWIRVLREMGCQAPAGSPAESASDDPRTADAVEN